MRLEDAAKAPRLDPKTIRVVKRAAIDGKATHGVEIKAGSTVMEAVRLRTPSLTDDQRKLLRVVSYERDADHVLAPHKWDRIKLRPGAMLLITDPPMGQGLKSILGVVVSIAALAFAGPLAGFLGLGGLGAFGTALLGSALAFAGNFLLNLLIPVREAKKESPTYTVSGFQNRANLDAPFPLPVGSRHRYAPPYAVPPILEVVDGKIVLRAAFVCGFAPMARFNEKIGDRLLSRFKFFETEYRGFVDDMGAVDNSPLTLIRDTTIQQAVDIELRKKEDGPEEGDGSIDSDPTSLFTAPDSARWRVIFQFPEGLYFTSTKDGNTSGQTCRVRIRERPVTPDNDGVWTTIEDYEIFDEKKRPFFVQYERATDFATRGAYEIEFLRSNDDDDKDNEHSVIKIIAFQSILPEYPINAPAGTNLGLVAVRMRATNQLQGTLDEYNGEFASLIEALNPATGLYEPNKETDNSADWYRRIETMPIQANPVGFDRLQADEIAAWHQHNIDQGLTFSRVYDYEISTQDMILDVCHAGRAVPRMTNGLRGVSVDAPKDELGAYPLTPHNSWGFEGSRSYSDFAHAFRIKFRDRTNNFKDAVREVVRPDFVGTPTKFDILEPPGLTDPDEAYRFGYFKWLEIFNRADTYTVSLDWETRMLQHGDLVLLLHRVLHKAHKSGFVSAVNGKAISLTETVTMEAGKSYAVKFSRLTEDGEPTPTKMVTWPVKTVAGESRMLSLVGDVVVTAGVSNLPDTGCIFAFGEADAINVLGVIQEVEPVEGGFGRLTVIPYAGDAIFPVMDALVVPPYNSRVGSILPDDERNPPVPSIMAVASSTSVYGDGETLPDDPRRVRVYLKSGAGSPPAAKYEVRHRETGEGSWRVPTIIISSSAGSALIATGYAKGDSIETQARAISWAGIPSAYCATTTHIVGSADPAPIPTPGSLSVLPAARDLGSGRIVIFNVSWTLPSYEVPLYPVVEWDSAGEGFAEPRNTIMLGQDATTTELIGMTIGEGYDVRVHFVDLRDNGNGPSAVKLNTLALLPQILGSRAGHPLGTRSGKVLGF